MIKSGCTEDGGQARKCISLRTLDPQSVSPGGRRTRRAPVSVCNSSGRVLQRLARYRGKDSKIIVRAILHSYVPISCREVLNNVGIASSPHQTFRSFHSIMHCRARDERLAHLRNCHATTVTCWCDENTGAQVVHRTGDRFCNSYVFQVLLYEG